MIERAKSMAIRKVRGRVSRLRTVWFQFVFRLHRLASGTTDPPGRLRGESENVTDDAGIDPGKLNADEKDSLSKHFPIVLLTSGQLCSASNEVNRWYKYQKSINLISIDSSCAHLPPHSTGLLAIWDYLRLQAATRSA